MKGFIMSIFTPQGYSPLLHEDGKRIFAIDPNSLSISDFTYIKHRSFNWNIFTYSETPATRGAPSLATLIFNVESLLVEEESASDLFEAYLASGHRKNFVYHDVKVEVSIYRYMIIADHDVWVANSRYNKKNPLYTDLEILTNIRKNGIASAPQFSDFWFPNPRR